MMHRYLPVLIIPMIRYDECKLGEKNDYYLEPRESNKKPNSTS